MSPKAAFTLAAGFTAALSVAEPTMADSRSGKIHLNKSFTMEVQRTPISNPTNPASREITVDCDKMMLRSDGAPIPSTQFVEQFDPNNDFPNFGTRLNPNFTLALQHIGERSPRDHELCTPQAELFSGSGKRRYSGGYVFKFKGSDYRLSAEMRDLRYCPVYVAMAQCTKRTNDDALMPRIYDIQPNGDLRLNRSELRIVENPPQLP